jgi:putative NADH-flavin reductase
VFDPVQGDVLDQGSIDAAMRGHEAVLSALGHKRFYYPVIARSSLEWAIVRPGALTNGDKRGRYRHGHQVGSFLLTARISRADVADFMLNQLESDTYLRTAPGVAW